MSRSAIGMIKKTIKFTAAAMRIAIGVGAAVLTVAGLLTKRR